MNCTNLQRNPICLPLTNVRYPWVHDTRLAQKVLQLNGDLSSSHKTNVFACPGNIFIFLGYHASPSRIVFRRNFRLQIAIFKRSNDFLLDRSSVKLTVANVSHSLSLARSSVRIDSYWDHIVCYNKKIIKWKCVYTHIRSVTCTAFMTQCFQIYIA